MSAIPLLLVTIFPLSSWRRPIVSLVSLEGGRCGGSRQKARKKVKNILERWQTSSVKIPQTLGSEGGPVSKGMGRQDGAIKKKDLDKVSSTEKETMEQGKRPK